jgi:hypothetical protein
MLTCLPSRHSRLNGYKECRWIDFQDRRLRSGLQALSWRWQPGGRWRVIPSTVLWLRNTVSGVRFPKAPVITATGGDIKISQGGNHSATTGGNPDLIGVSECALSLSPRYFTSWRPFVGWFRNSACSAGGPESFVVVRMRSYSKFAKNRNASSLANSGYQLTESGCVSEHLLPCHAHVHRTDRSSGV